MGVSMDPGRWLTPLSEHYDALIERARDRLDATAGRPLRAWLRPIMLAVAITIGLVALLRLLLTGLTAGGPVSRWIGAFVAGVLALVLLVVVIRNVVISLIEPHQRRLLLVALLTSTAAVLVGVEAFAATSVALAERVPPLWTAERFYLWHLVDAVPLLDIPDRLGWTEPAILPGLAGRVLVLGFALIVIPSLVRVGVAAYGYVEGQAQQRRYTRAISRQVSTLRLFAADREAPFVLVVGATAGAVWSLGGRYLDGAVRVWSLATLAFLAAVALGAVLARFAGAVLAELAEQAWAVTAILAAALVWFDSPARRALLPGAAGWGAWGRVWATFGVWLVVLLLAIALLWATPEFTDAAVSLALVVGFLGPDAPAARWLDAHLTWQPWDLPLSRVAVGACAWFTVAYLLRNLWLAARRPPILGHTDHLDTASGLRQDLRAYALVAVQIVIAAGAALVLLRSAGVTRGPDDAWTEASRALTVATWHVLDSLPGPDVPEVLDWRLTADLSGPWAGLVVILAVAAVLIFAGLPILRTVVLWARLTAGHPRTGEALAAVPAKVVADLRAVLTYLEAEAAGVSLDDVTKTRRSWPLNTPQEVTIPAVVVADERLVAAELNRTHLLDLFGAPSRGYDLADAALRHTAEAFRAAVRGSSSVSARRVSHPRPGRLPAVDLGVTVSEAREAVDRFAAVVERWDHARRDVAHTGD
ncbi:hypothetical protein [Luedemannella helvata]|uniref:DUF4129 domain-containing protein n=1 Tax=Luedemannella helvata TaxID=349315 RepID=A0ABP4VSW4_9ACTN